MDSGFFYFLLPIKRKYKAEVFLLSFLLKEKKQKFKTVNSLYAKTTKLVRLRDPSRSKSYFQYENNYLAPSGSLGRPLSMDKLLVLQHKEFKVAKPNQEVIS